MSPEMSDAFRALKAYFSGVKTADPWIAAQQDVHRVAGGKLTLVSGDLKGSDGRVHYFGDNFKLK